MSGNIESKGYVVNYQLMADASNVVTQLSNLQTLARELQTPMQQLQRAMLQVVNTIRLLDQSKNYKFTPTIDTGGFRAGLKEMETAVQQTAARMQAELNKALTASPKARTAASNAINNPKTSAQLKQTIGNLEKELDKIMGAKTKQGMRNGKATMLRENGDLFYAKQANNVVKATELKHRADILKKLISQTKKQYRETLTQEKELAKTQDKVEKGASGHVNNGKTPQTNFTPAAIKELRGWFGNKKSITLKINANASSALTELNKVKSEIEAIRSMAKFSVTPLMNPEVFAQTKAKMAELEAMANTVRTALSTPISAQNKAKATRAANAAKATEQKVNVIGEVTKVVPKGELVLPSLVGEITKVITKTNLTIPVKGNVQLGWEKGAVGKNNQLKAFNKQVPPIKLYLDTSEASAALSALIAEIKAVNPQTLQLLAASQAAKNITGTASVTGGSTATGTTSGTKSHTEETKKTTKKAASKAVSVHQKRADMLKNNFRNAIINRVPNKSLLNDIMANRSIFRRAVNLSGINPISSAALTPYDNVKYLNTVSALMGEAGRPVPFSVVSATRAQAKEIAKLEKQEQREYQKSARRGMAGMVTVNQTSSAKTAPYYDRVRRFAYPFTGNTSFGARTPMAVNMAKGMGTMMAVGGIMSAVGSSFSQAIEYQNTMKTAQAILKNGTNTYSDAGFREMEQTIRRVGVETKFTAPQVAGAARFLAMAGMDIPMINAAIRPIADMALIGDNDIAEVADKMTNIMTTFNIKPNQVRDVANIMTAVATGSNTDLMMLAESAKYGGGVANMYGGDNKWNLADTMAMFGVMGNAGIQASLAGTALRMIYQNIMNPNKKQAAVLKQYNIQTKDKNGQVLPLVNILQQISRVGHGGLKNIVSHLFRITAQNGAYSLLNQLTQGDQEAQATIIKGLNGDKGLANTLMKQGNLNTLIGLMLKARMAPTTTISQDIAGEKKNTIQGLAAQASSAFTEGIVKAFERRQGGIAGMLGQLRNYFAKPETMEMFDHLIDLVIELGKLAAKFAEIWGKMYSAAPGLFKTWMYAQMLFTQLGTLMTPFVVLTGVVSRLKKIIVGTLGFLGISTATSATTGIASAGVKAMASGATRAGIVSATTSGTIPVITPLGGNAITRSATPAIKRNWGASRYITNLVQKNPRVHLNAKALDTSILALDTSVLAMDATISALTQLPKRNKKTEAALQRAIAAKTFAERKVEPMVTAYQYRKPRQLNDMAIMARYVNMGGTRFGVPERFNQIRTERRLAMGRIENEIYPSTPVSVLERRRRWANNSMLVADAIAAGWKPSGRLSSHRNFDWVGRRAQTYMLNRPKQLKNSSLLYRAAQINAHRSGKFLIGWNQAWKSGLAFSLPSLVITIGQVLKKALFGLTRAFSALLSPIGLTTIGVGALAAIMVMSVKRMNKAIEEEDKQIKKITSISHNNRTRQANNAKRISNTLPKITPISVNSPIANQTKVRNAFKRTYGEAFASANYLSNVNKLASSWNKDLFENPNNIFAFADDINNHIIQKTYRQSQGQRFLDDSKYMLEAVLPQDQMAIDALFMAGANAPRTVFAQKMIIELRKKLIAGKITKEQFDKAISIIIGKVANPNASGLLNANQYTPQQINDTPDISQFQQFQQGAWNLLMAEVSGKKGTASGREIAMAELKTKINAFSSKWWEDIGYIIEGYEYPIKIGEQQFNLAIKTFDSGPNIGKINFAATFEKIKDKIKTFATTLMQFSEMAGNVYLMLAKMGLVPNGVNDFIKYNRETGAHEIVRRADVESYLKARPYALPNGMTKEQFIQGVISNKRDDGFGVHRVKIRNWIAKNTGVQMYNQYKKALPKSPKKNNKNNKNNTSNNDNVSNSNVSDTSAPSQSDYTSSYDRSAATPTQVVINIGNVAQFDRTQISSEATENDMAIALETKITDAIYRLFAQAAPSISAAMSTPAV